MAKQFTPRLNIMENRLLGNLSISHHTIEQLKLKIKLLNDDMRNSIADYYNPNELFMNANDFHRTCQILQYQLEVTKYQIEIIQKVLAYDVHNDLSFNFGG